MSTNFWMLEEDLCRCCHSEGTFQNLAGAFNFGEEEENMYLNMLLETLDINLKPVSGPLCVATFTICDACITRLRDAACFKKQVMCCEKKFNDMYGRNLIRIAETDYKVEIKEEDLDGDIENADELTREDSLDDSFDLDHEDKPESSVIKRETKRKPKKPSQRAKTKPTPKKTPKKCGRPRKIKDITDEKAAGDNNTADSGLKKSKLHELLTQDPMRQYYPVIEDGVTSKYVCRKCQKTFPDEDTVKQHIETSHNASHLEAAGNYICKVCFKEHRTLRTRNYHMLRKCPECDMKFTMPYLKKHRHEMHGMQLPTCGICGYCDWSMSRINQHQRRVHMKEKNVSCDQCDMKFYNKSTLNRHKIAHGTDRKYECSFCHKKYPRIGTLRMHEKIHTKKKDKVCSVCGDRFVQKASLNYHMKKRHPEAV